MKFSKARITAASTAVSMVDVFIKVGCFIPIQPEGTGFIYPSEMKIQDLVYRFFHPLHPKRFAIGQAITHLFGCNGQKNRIDQKPVSSLPMGIHHGKPVTPVIKAGFYFINQLC